MDGFQEHCAHSFSLTSTIVMLKVCLDMAKVTVKEQMLLVQSLFSTFINKFQNNIAHMFSLTSTSVMRKVFLDTLIS